MQGYYSVTYAMFPMAGKITDNHFIHRKKNVGKKNWKVVLVLHLRYFDILDASVVFTVNAGYCSQAD